jgi:acetyltransferase
VDLIALEQLLVKFSQIVVEQSSIREIEINPLLASANQLLALDARVILHPLSLPESELPKLAIRPYPSSYVTPWTLPNGEAVILRPIRPEDEPLMIRLHQTLSEQSVYLRYFGSLSLSERTAHQRLIRMCFIDYDREMALVAVRGGAETGAPEIIGVGRLIKRHGTADAEIAVLVTDRFQDQGVGTELVRQLLKIGPQEGVHRFVAQILPENEAMQRVFRKHGFQLRHDAQNRLVHAQLTL